MRLASEVAVVLGVIVGGDAGDGETQGEEQIDQGHTENQPPKLRDQRLDEENDEGCHEEEIDPSILHARAPTIREIIPATNAAPGIVKIHAHTTRPATRHRTADILRAAPTPTMAPVMVCVVDTGIP